METKHHRARVFKDPYNWPSWQVYYGNMWIGSAHTRVVAGNAARLAVKCAGSMCEQNTTALRIIQEVNRQIMGQPQWMNMWKPGIPHFTHTQHRELTRNSKTSIRGVDLTGKVIWTWEPLAA